MTIYPPEGSYSRNDMRMVKLLAAHLAEVPDGTVPTNSLHAVHLADSDIDALVDAIERKLEDREFRLASELVDAVSSRDSERIRELYLSGRTRRQHTRTMASKQHAEFLARLGLQSPLPSWYVPTDRMTFEHFVRMERRAFHQLGISPRVTDLAIRFICSQAEEVEGVRDGRVRLSANFLVAALEATKTSLLRLKQLPGSLTDAQQLAGVLTVTVNVGVYYTTRDWSVAGTLSTIAGGLGAMAPGRR